MKKRIFNLIILDESGSMFRISKQAVDGVNETLQTIRKAQEKNTNQEQFVTFVTFNDEMTTVYDLINGADTKDITSKDYCPGGCTALFDAMGTSIANLRKHVSEDDIVLVTIITDGYENSSREFNVKMIKEIVSDLKTKGWLFTYMGANQNVEEVAMSMAISNYTEFEATEDGTRCAMAEQSRCRYRLYSMLANDEECADLFEGKYFDKDK